VTHRPRTDPAEAVDQGQFVGEAAEDADEGCVGSGAGGMGDGAGSSGQGGGRTGWERPFSQGNRAVKR
jgi:hypothetical protein